MAYYKRYIDRLLIEWKGMQSLWIFMRKRKLHEAVRTSLANFGQFDHYDPKDEFEQ